MLRVHPVSVAAFDDDVRGVHARRNAGRKIAHRRFADNFFYHVNGFLEILLLFIAFFHVAVVMNPRFRPDLVALRNDFLEDLRIILNRYSGREERSLNFLLLQYIEKTVDSNAFAEFTIGDDRQVLFGRRILRPAAAILLLLGKRAAEIFRPGFKRHARRDGDARAIRPFDWFSFRSCVHTASFDV